MARIGVFGGTFDPPHVGHLIVAQDLLDALALDRLLLVPAGDPPHKAEGGTAPAEVRARMTEAAVGDHPRITVSRMELERPGPSYTVDTLRELRRLHPGDDLFLAVGADQMRSFHSWRDPAEIAALARIVVLAREGMRPEEAAAGAGLPFEAVHVTRVDVSSTEIRRRIREGRSVRYWVPEAVRRIIEHEQPYGTR